MKATISFDIELPDHIDPSDPCWVENLWRTFCHDVSCNNLGDALDYTHTKALKKAGKSDHPWNDECFDAAIESYEADHKMAKSATNFKVTKIK